MYTLHTYMGVVLPTNYIIISQWSPLAHMEIANTGKSISAIPFLPWTQLDKPASRGSDCIYKISAPLSYN